MYQSMKAAPGYLPPPSSSVVLQREIKPEELEEFDKEYEAFVAEQRRLKAEREAAQQNKKKRGRKNANNQSDQQIETDLKLLTASLSD